MTSEEFQNKKWYIGQTVYMPTMNWEKHKWELEITKIERICTVKMKDAEYTYYILTESGHLIYLFPQYTDEVYTNKRDCLKSIRTLNNGL